MKEKGNRKLFSNEEVEEILEMTKRLIA